MDGIQLAEFLQKSGYKIKEKTKGTVVVLVDGNRIEKMLELASMLSGVAAKVDRTATSKSSIGRVIVGSVNVYFKSEGKSGGLDVEAAAMSMLEDLVVQAVIISGQPIDIKVKGRTAKGVIGVSKTAGTPKSDFHLIDEGGRALVHVSHKKGSTPRDFQQWGGLTEKRIAEHPEVLMFEQKLQMVYPGGVMPSGESAYMKIASDDLKMMAVYGVNYDKSNVDVNRVDVLIQGDPGLKSLGKQLYELTATGNIHYLKDKITGGFEPVLAMIYKGDRSQLGLKGGRASVYPMGGRTFKREIR